MGCAPFILIREICLGRDVRECGIRPSVTRYTKPLKLKATIFQTSVYTNFSRVLAGPLTHARAEHGVRADCVQSEILPLNKSAVPKTWGFRQPISQEIRNETIGLDRGDMPVSSNGR